MKPSKRDTFAAAMDDLIARVGTREQLEKEGNKHANRLGLKTRCTQNVLRAHIKYRQIKDENYPGKRKVTVKEIL